MPPRCARRRTLGRGSDPCSPRGREHTGSGVGWGRGIVRVFETRPAASNTIAHTHVELCFQVRMSEFRTGETTPSCMFFPFLGPHEDVARAHLRIRDHERQRRLQLNVAERARHLGKTPRWELTTHVAPNSIAVGPVLLFACWFALHFLFVLGRWTPSWSWHFICATALLEAASCSGGFSPGRTTPFL